MASSFIAWCQPCCAVRTFSVRAVLGTTARGDTLVRGRCPQCHRTKEGIVKGEER